MPDSGIDVLFEGRNAIRLLEGLGVTLGISAIAVLLSLLLGILVGLAMVSRFRLLRLLM